MVVAELRDRGALRAEQGGFDALVVHLGDGDQLPATDERADLGLDVAGNLVAAVDQLADRGANLQAAVLAGEFDVPAVVLAALATSQRDLRTGEPEILGVVVDRREAVRPGLAHLLDTGDAGEVGGRDIVCHGELGFDLEEGAGAHRELLYNGGGVATADLSRPSLPPGRG